MASFPYNSPSLLFQQPCNISPSAEEEANSPQCCSQAGHKVRAKTLQVLATMDVKGFYAHPGKIPVPGNHQFPPQVKPLVNMQCHRAALTGWDSMKQKWIFRNQYQTSVSPSQMMHGHLPCWSIEHHSHNQGPQSIAEPASFLTPLLFHTSRFHFSSSIQHGPNSIEILTPPHSYCNHLIYGSQMLAALSDTKLVFSSDHKHP